MPLKIMATRLGAALALGLCLVLASATAAASAERLVTIGSDVTEIVFALGAGDAVVAVDGGSRYPAETLALPDLGYMRRLSAEPIMALAPSLVLISEKAGPPHVMDQLEAGGIALLRVSGEPTAEALEEKILAIGAALGREAEAEALRRQVAQALADLAQSTAGIGERPRVLLMISVGQGRLMAAGAGSSGERIIELAGGVNAISGIDDYKPLSAEAAIMAAPEVIVVPSQSLELLGGIEAVQNLPQLRMTPAVQNGRIVSIDSLLLLGFGPRLAEGATLLAEALHGQAIRREPH